MQYRQSRDRAPKSFESPLSAILIPAWWRSTTATLRPHMPLKRSARISRPWVLQPTQTYGSCDHEEDKRVARCCGRMRIP